MTVLIAFVAIICTAPQSELHGTVVAVKDGDTLVILGTDNIQRTVRLTEIDTPERKQPYGTQAKKALSDLAFGKPVRVETSGEDRYGRILGRIFVGKLDVNAELVRRGVAWVYRRYSKDPRLLELEAEARQKGRGLWGLPEAERVPPWEWRRSRR
jgi:endonuclease YncB( thermonuclease family)